jgi:iron complex transport system substrate-binding protein
MIFALGAGDRLVGRDSNSDYPPGKRPRGVQGIPVVGDFTGPFAESTVAARPDFIIVQGETYGRARIEDWQKKTGVPVAALSATSVDGVADGLKKIGAWLDASVPARNLASRLYLQRKDPRGVTAFFEVGRKPLWTAGRDTLIDDILTRAGFTNAARDVASYKQYNLETLLARQPDFYVVTSGRLKTGQDLRSALDAERARVLVALRREPGFKGLKAVQNGRVIVVPSDWALRPGPRIYGAIQSMSEQVARLEKPAPAENPTPVVSPGNRI